MTSIGTLFAFVVVCAAVLVLRVKRPDAKRPFRVPFGPIFPVLGILSCCVLDAEPAGAHVGAVPRVARHRHDHLLAYGRTHSPLVNQAESKARTRDAIAGELHHDVRPAADLQRGLHRDPRLLDASSASRTRPRRSGRRSTSRPSEARSTVRLEFLGGRDRGVGGRLRPDEGVGRKGIARRLDGVACAARIREDVAPRIAAFRQRHGRPPGLAWCWPDRIPPPKSTFAIRSRRWRRRVPRRALPSRRLGDTGRGAGAGRHG